MQFAFSYPLTLLIVCPLLFLAGFVDSIAGGGGLISLPAYIFAGVPIHAAYGSNKFSSFLGTGVSVVNYARNRCIDLRAAFSGGVGALVGSWCGTHLALHLSQRALQICLIVILPIVAVFVIIQGAGRMRLWRKKVQLTEKAPLPRKQFLALTFFIGLALGAYDGFFGPGTGMFLALALSGIARLDLVKATGSTKAINFASNLASVITWLPSGQIIFPLAVPCMLCNMAGNFLGSRLAIKVGAKFIRPVIIIVAILLFVKVLQDIVK
jgi:uncharacterized membrane protein YfcA